MMNNSPDWLNSDFFKRICSLPFVIINACEFDVHTVLFLPTHKTSYEGSFFDPFFRHYTRMLSLLGSELGDNYALIYSDSLY